MNEPLKRPQRKISEQERVKIREQHKGWLRHMAVGAIDGILVGIVVGLALIGFDINGIGSMLANSKHQLGYTLLLLASLAQTFGMVSAGAAVWLKATQEDEDV
ncbi:MAG: hypothetical protein AAFN43_08140 [Pseudomonadota bacterium]